MEFLELTARRIGRRVLLAAIELYGLYKYLGGRETIDAEELEAVRYTLDSMHYSETVYSFGERLKIIFAGPFALLITRILIRIYRAAIRYEAEEA